jgi:phage terminase small subunit
MRKKFAEGYAVSDNAYQSAVAAGYAESTALKKSYELVRDPLVKAEVARLRDEMTRELLRPDKLIAEMHHLAMADLSDVAYVENGNVFVEDTRSLPRAQRVAVTSVKQGMHGIEVKTANKQRALEKLMTIAGLDGRQEEKSGPVAVVLQGEAAKYAE